MASDESAGGPHHDPRGDVGSPDGAALDAVVAECFPGAHVVDVVPLDGGLSAAMDVVTLAGAPHERVVLRRLPVHWGHDAESAERERRGHEVAAAAGIPVPPVLWADVDGERFGRPTLLLPFVPGRPIVGELGDPVAARALAEAIGLVGDVRRVRDTSLPVLADHAAHRGLFGGPRAHSSVVDAPALMAAVDRLASHAGPPGDLLHGDLHGGNVLWDGTAVTAVVDWPGVAWGVRWYDEAYAVADTTFAHGAGAGEQLLAALRSRRDSPSPSDDAWALWTGAALVRALPTPVGWLAAYLSAGVEVTADELDARYVAAVERWLDAHG